MTPSKILFYFGLSFVAGIFLESLIKIPQIFVCGILILGIILILVSLFLSFPRLAQPKLYAKEGKRESRVNAQNSGFRVKPGMTGVLGFCILFLALGILRMQISEYNILNDKLSKYNGIGKVALTGIISGEPDVRDTFQKLRIKVGDSVVLITTDRYPEYKYLDTIKITGNLETPQETDDFSYKNYLMKDGIYSVMFYPKIELISKARNYNFFTFIYEKLLFLKQKVRESIQYNFSPPQSSILEGTILGDNGAMSNDLKNKLNITGLRHIIAVSGTHVVILSSIIMYLLIMTGLNRGNAFYFAIAFLCFYIILIGFPASGVRAGIMGGLYLLAQKLGRQSMGIRVIVLACAAMLLFNPLLLFYDVGFQLSFLAVIGLIYLDPIFTKIIKIFTKKKAENVVKIVSTTFAAQVFTLPILIYSFGNISFVSPITNLLIAPAVSGLMISGFLTAFVGIFSTTLGWVASVPCYFILQYFLWIIDFFSQPWAQKTFENVHWAWLMILYLAIIFITRFLYKKYVQKF